MANALDSDSKDREFESLRADHVVASYISLAATLNAKSLANCKACLLSLFTFMNYRISCNADNTADYIKNYIINIKCTGCKNILKQFN